MSRLREGRANTARGAAHFLRETVGRVRYGGATAQLTVRADSGFYATLSFPPAGKFDHRPPARQPAGPRGPERTPIPYWIVAETTYTPFQTPDAAPCCGSRNSRRVTW